MSTNILLRPTVRWPFLDFNCVIHITVLSRYFNRPLNRACARVDISISEISSVPDRCSSRVAKIASHSSPVRVAGEEVDDALHRPARWRLAGMHSGCDNDAPLPAHLLVVGRRGDRQVIHAVSGQAAAQQAQLGEPRFRGVGHDLAEILLGQCLRGQLETGEVDRDLIYRRRTHDKYNTIAESGNRSRW